MAALRKLSLAGTSVGDEGVPHLAELKNLEYLWLNGTRVSDSAYMTLKAALPECQIER
jgi:hypothetical protein